jgi:Na+-translocating ferredoxin:NAD+ oxidoreductase RNF subunit RnfB
MGFGAGLGLPNIKRHSDQFEIDSTIGRGTRVKSVIWLKDQEAGIQVPHSLRVTAELCCGCLHCLHTCPTRAIRVRDDHPQVLDYLCIDCTACIGVCETGALNMECADTFDMPEGHPTLVVPSSFLVQFIPEATPRGVFAGLEELGFASIRFTEGWETALHTSVLVYAEEQPNIRPVISPVCPAIINILEMKFPSLLSNVAPFLSPVEAAYDELREQQVVFVPACPSHQTMLTRRGLSSALKAVSPSALSQAVLPHLHTTNDTREQWEAIPRPTSRPLEDDPDRLLQVSGIRNVVNILEKIETGLLNDVPVLELYACDQGCFGSPLLTEGPFIARFRWLHSFIQYNPDARAVRRTTPLVSRSGFRLAPDMAQAIERLSQIEELTKELPGKNCGMCGAPTCNALAEDVVMGRATKTACIYMRE